MSSFNSDTSPGDPSQGDPPFSDAQSHTSISIPSLNPQQISDLEEQWRENRTKITLFQQPRKTLYLFFAASYNVLKNTFSYLISHPMLLKFLLPLVSLWYLLEFIPGFYTDSINEIEFWIQYIVWWIGLGILSSIGLGSGLQTGVLFLFPHIMRVCITAQSCRSTNFNSFGAIWFHSAEAHHLFKCLEEPSPDQPLPSYLSVWFLVLVPSFLQSTGTAIGEIPPYWLTRAARQAAIEAGEKTDVPEELEANSQYNFINRLKGRMISFLRSHGFLGVFLMASWPNFAFDLCGICCGHFLMPFWTFFGATFLGKACVRNTYQTLILVALLSEHHLNSVIGTLQACVPARFHTVVEVYLREALEEMKDSAHEHQVHASPDTVAKGSGDSSYLAAIWASLMTAVLTFFLLSCVNQFAQLYQALIDKDLIEDLKQQLPPQVLKELTCSATGKIILPPPTSRTLHFSQDTTGSLASSCPLDDLPATSSSSSTPTTPVAINLIASHQSETSLRTPEGSPSSNPRRATSFSVFRTPPRSSSRSEYSPGNAFVLAVIDGNRERNRSRLSLSPQAPAQSSPWTGSSSSVGLTNRKESSAATTTATSGSGPVSGGGNQPSVPLVVRRTNLFNFSTGVMEGAASASAATSSHSDNANKRCD